MFRSKKFRAALGVVVTLVLLVTVSGFALSQGYLMHFLMDEQTISRDQFFGMADMATQYGTFRLMCAQGELALGWPYIYEVHCFSTEDAVVAYMAARYGG